MIESILSAITVCSVLAHLVNASTSCSLKHLVPPKVFETRIMTAAEVFNFSSKTPEIGGYPAGPLSGLDFCNVTITYTHPGQDDTINVQVWLPLEGWNGRFQGVGGGGWSGSLGSLLMSPAIAAGYAAASSDAGHDIALTPAYVPDAWAQISPGNVNMYLLQDFAHIALNDMAIIGKAITASYYGKPASYSYWYGCSAGGRQGLMLAQRYPGAYDGILATAPAIDWASLMMANFWPQQVMNRLGMTASSCEMEAFRREAIQACDGLDGLIDGIIADSRQCNFSPQSVVGKSFHCDSDDSQRALSAEGAEVISAFWTGPRSAKAGISWPGVSKDADPVLLTSLEHVGAMKQLSTQTIMSDSWMRLFVSKDPSLNLSNLSEEAYFSMFHTSTSQYVSIISANDPNLSGFRDAGGKMITWHGLADQLITPRSTEDYYKRVLHFTLTLRSFIVTLKPLESHIAGMVQVPIRLTHSKDW